MMQFKKTIETEISGGRGFYTTNWARHHKVGTVVYDVSGKRWEVCEDIYFDKFWFRETVI
ncbi:hypothetical protein AXI71_gp21 [Lactococcus phage GE1]|uniref:Uncharacterized protein n=1 Tax=Lactococcus phage GE1 TaxID=1698369 RepID=A0A0N9BB31_9CAUD|nr:hypothetical protein AXI71_gp21 [Lactococcus phage GE1]ALA06975.1 hypothetical protein [Lactococcus phage GE1]